MGVDISPPFSHGQDIKVRSFMKMVLHSVTFIADALSSCAAGAQAVPEGPPIYPIWNKAQMPDGRETASDLVPVPTASAVLVAPGYLLTSAEALGKTSVRFDLPDSDVVFIFDGKDWHSGRYVDYDSRSNLALIRADVPGTPVALATKEQGPVRLKGIPWTKSKDRPIVHEVLLLAACDGPPDLLDGIIGQRPRVKSLCFQGRVKTLAGGALVDGDGRLVALQVNSAGSHYHAGVGAAELRNFVERYFSSWGRDVKDKPIRFYQK
jgi:hypothetical protein